MNDEKTPINKLGYITGVFLLLVFSVPLFTQRLPKFQELREILSGFFEQEEICFRSAEALMNTLKVTVQQYKILNRALPTTEQGLAALVTPPASARVQRKLIDSYALIDPWGHPYQYQMPGESRRPYHIWSFGPDGKNGTEDDLHVE